MHTWIKLTRVIVIVSVIILALGQANGLNVAALAIRDQDRNEPKEIPSPVIVRVGDYVVTVKDLEQIIATYPASSITSRESKAQLVKSLITTKLFALAARSAKLDETEDFHKEKEQARERLLAYPYFQRYVQPKFSGEAARKYFEAHKDQYKSYRYFRNEIVALLRDKALKETRQSLMQHWEVKQNDDLLKDLDLRNASSSLVLAQVGPGTITLRDLLQLASLNDVPPTDFSSFKVKKDLLDWLVLERLCALAAEKEGMANDPEVQKLFDWFEDQLLAMRYTRLVQEKVSLEDARQYYKTHPEEFKGPDQLHLRQIVVATQEEAVAVKAKLDQGKSFEEMAKTSSIDEASARKGGDIGWVRPGRLHPEVEKVAYQLKTGQVSKPIKTPDGYILVRLDERLEGAMKPFNAGIASSVMEQLSTQATDAERRRLMKIYKVTINEELL